MEVKDKLRMIISPDLSEWIDCTICYVYPEPVNSRLGFNGLSKLLKELDHEPSIGDAFAFFVKEPKRRRSLSARPEAAQPIQMRYRDDDRAEVTMRGMTEGLVGRYRRDRRNDGGGGGWLRKTLVGTRRDADHTGNPRPRRGKIEGNDNGTGQARYGVDINQKNIKNKHVQLIPASAGTWCANESMLINGEGLHIC